MRVSRRALASSTLRLDDDRPYRSQTTLALAGALPGKVRQSTLLPQLRSESIVEEPEIEYEFRSQASEAPGEPHSHRRNQVASKNADIFKGLHASRPSGELLSLQKERE